MDTIVKRSVEIETVLLHLHPVINREDAVAVVDVRQAGREMIVKQVAVCRCGC